MGGRSECKRSIHWPERSVSANRFLSAVSQRVSKRPIWLGDAAPEMAAALPPTTQRIAGSCRSLAVVHVLVAGEPTEHRLPKHSDETMLIWDTLPRFM